MAARAYGRRQGGKCFAPVRPDIKLTGKTHLHDIYDKKGRSGRMIFIVVRLELFDEQRASRNNRFTFSHSGEVAMSVNTIHDVEFGAELPVFEPDTRIENTMAFAKSVGWGRTAL